MKYQSDPDLKATAKSDCFIFDILRIHEIVGKHEFSTENIKEIRRVCVRADFHDKDGYINERGIAGISTVASGITRKHVFIKRVTSNDIYNFLLARYSRTISGGNLFSHFVLANMINPHDVDYDSWSEEGSRTVREGNITGYRYIFAEAL